MNALPILTDFSQAALLPTHRSGVRRDRVSGGTPKTTRETRALPFRAGAIPGGALVWLNPQLLRRLA
jgi:hypothetical protein